MKISSYKKQDIYYTPEWAVESILKYIPKDKVIWEPCCGKLNMTNVLKENGYTVISTDIEMDKKYDFLTYEPEENYDYIITNPPYTIKTEIIKRCYELKKPFMLLLPLPTMESQVRINLFKEYGITYFQFTRRVNYYSTYKNKYSSSPFYSLWLGWKIPNTEHGRFYFLNEEPFYIKWKEEQDNIKKIEKEKKKIKLS